MNHCNHNSDIQRRQQHYSIYSSSHFGELCRSAPSIHWSISISPYQKELLYLECASLLGRLGPIFWHSKPHVSRFQVAVPQAHCGQRTEPTSSAVLPRYKPGQPDSDAILLIWQDSAQNRKQSITKDLHVLALCCFWSDFVGHCKHSEHVIRLFHKCHQQRLLTKGDRLSGRDFALLLPLCGRSVMASG